MSGANVSPIGRNKEEWLVQATDYRKLNEPPRPRLQRNGTIYFMARPPLLCQGGDFAFPAGCPRRPCPADHLWVMTRHHRKEGNSVLDGHSRVYSATVVYLEAARGQTVP